MNPSRGLVSHCVTVKARCHSSSFANSVVWQGEVCITSTAGNRLPRYYKALVRSLRGRGAPPGCEWKGSEESGWGQRAEKRGEKECRAEILEIVVGITVT